MPTEKNQTQISHVFPLMSISGETNDSNRSLVARDQEDRKVQFQSTTRKLSREGSYNYVHLSKLNKSGFLLKLVCYIFYILRKN